MALCFWSPFWPLRRRPRGLVSFRWRRRGRFPSNGSGDSTIPIGTPWTFEITYDTAAPDLDFELTGSPDPTFGRFTNTAAPPALTSFHYQAGSYEVTIDDPADFGTGSAIHITFTAVHAIDINVFAPALFPPLAGGAVSFHADFNDFSSDPIFVSDALPTNTALSPGNFDAEHRESEVLGPPAGVVGSSSLSSLTVTAVPEPSTAALVIVGLLVLFGAKTPPRPRPRIRNARIPRRTDAQGTVVRAVQHTATADAAQPRRAVVHFRLVAQRCTAGQQSAALGRAVEPRSVSQRRQPA